MARYSKIYRMESGRQYRYDFEEAMLQWITPASTIKADNERWQKEFGEDLWESRDLDAEGNMINDQIGLSNEGWKKDREGYLSQYDSELSEELGYLVADAKKEFGIS